ncbi:MAG: rubredoxin [Firmicutes bacterium]|nr:rubredoxin [Bacillota bacterium]
MIYICNVCGYQYTKTAGEPDSGVAPGTAWADVSSDFVCPVCGVGKDEFSPD